MTIFRPGALYLLKKVRQKSVESILKKALGLLNPEMVEEIRKFIKEKQTSEGGYADRSGKPDLYYSLFGYYLAEALSININAIQFKTYIKDRIISQKLSGVHLYCGAILYAKTYGTNHITSELGKQIAFELRNERNNQKEYLNFMGFLALWYLGDYLALGKLIKQYHGVENREQVPCPVTAANAILSGISGKSKRSFENELKSFIGRNGGFKALANAPYEDLLSTGVALYALNFINADLRIIKPDCLSFIDSLYLNGGFRATPADLETDIEYTFYGLLALGSLL